MNWKIFIVASVSTALLALPQNSFTCGPTEDPYDYYTSFFNNKAGTSAAYKPFYYTALLTFYDDWEWNANEDSLSFVNKKIADEWAAYGKATKATDAVNLVYLTKANDLAALAAAASFGKALPVSLAKNSVAQTFAKDKKAEAVSYLQFANKTENISASSGWEDRKKDSLQINRYIAEATDAFTKTNDAFLKNKWAFQRIKLAFYNNRYADCIRWYDEVFNEANTSAVNELALSYKAGSLFRLGRNKKAAYAFSKAFSLSDQNKRSNFLGFLWSTDNCNQALITEYTPLCKNDLEKANMLALFGMYGSEYRLDNLQKVHAINAASPLLPLLATREINKLEEQYFTAVLAKEKGGKQRYISWAEVREDAGDNKSATDQKAQVTKTAQAFEKLMADKDVPNRSLYGAGAAYLHYMNRDYAAAKALLSKTKELPQEEKVKEQLQLITLLVAANEGGAISKEREAQLLPALKWLTQKAKTDDAYRIFCRNFFSEILSQKYEQQADAARAAFAYAVADLSFLQKGENDYYYNYAPALEFVRNEMSTDDLVKLYNLMTSPATETEKFFVQNSSVKRDAVIDVLGTSYLRDRNYAKAIEWLSKAGKPESLRETQYNYQTGKETTLNVDPFFDYLNDWQRYSKAAPTAYTKLTLAKKLQEMKAKIDAATAGDNSKLLYEYASALYNMSYYGNSWNAVAYSRSSVDWNNGNYKAPWEKEYFGVHEARTYYQKAYDAALNKEFKAACLFMVAKCAQKQIPMPEYDYKNYEQYQKNMDAFYVKFMDNPLFGKFKSEFGSTKFYQYAYNRCSYLQDYVKKTAAPAKTTKPRAKG
ncbi:MAG TPA: hypothetical protein VMR70_14620 [Flavisolibacter sp.]|nr:hypothetical protein [Flavisolibacter sp.]